ncbi:MAG TPA: amidohydrolase, partial [Cytophagales bacterium]|nr:amidohydrolase [Cytophagales bacterium]
MRLLLVSILLSFACTTYAQTVGYYLEPEWVFDGEALHQGWVVRVQGNQIVEAGPRRAVRVQSFDEVIKLPNKTLMPGMIEGHSHLLLYPYNITNWNDQVLKESSELRAIRGAEAAKTTLLAGWTTVRVLGSEGAGYADVAIKQAIEQGIIIGPRLLVAGPAIVATGSYGPKGFHPGVEVPLGAEAADGDELVTVVRRQIGHGADFIKVYADYRWGPNKEAMPTFSEAELRLIVETAASSGRVTVAHASTA